MRSSKFVMGSLAVVFVLEAGGAQAAGDAAKGAQVFARCAICHTNTKGAGNLIGPDLFGIVGRKAGTVPGFSYSSAMKGSGIVWTDAKLDAYIKSPPTVVPGNRMPFAGLPDAGQRADLIAYLDTLK